MIALKDIFNQKKYKTNSAKLPCKIVIAGYFGAGNLGDESILAAELDALKKNYSITVLSINPNISKALPSLNIERLPSLKNPAELKAFIKTISRNDALLLGGGGFIANKLQPLSLYYWLFLISCAKLLRKRVFLFSIGCGPFRSGISVALAKIVLNRVNVILPRDQISANLIQEITGESNKIVQTADITFLLNAKIKNDPSLIDIVKKNPRPFVLFAMCSRFHEPKIWHGKTYDVKFQQYVQAISDLADFVVETLGGTPIFFPFFNNDLRFYAYVLQKMRFAKHVRFVPYTLDVDAVLSLFHNCDFVIGSRYHSIVFSILAEVPILPIVYHHKSYSLAKQVGLETLEIGDNIEWPERSIDTERAKEIILRILRNKENIVKQMHVSRLILIAQAQKNVAILENACYE
jgi:polysaccharide pyruvyl transferase CsaB